MLKTKRSLEEAGRHYRKALLVSHSGAVQPFISAFVFLLTTEEGAAVEQGIVGKLRLVFVQNESPCSAVANTLDAFFFFFSVVDESNAES